MTTTHIACAYKATAVGAVPVGQLAVAMAAVPIDLTIPNMVGLLYESDTIGTVGQVVTRTFSFRARPSVDAAGTVTLFPGEPSGSPVEALTLTNPGALYAAPPIVHVGKNTEKVPARIIAEMGVGSGIVINGGTGYVAPTITFVGGMLAPGGAQATATIAQIAGVLQAPVIVTPGGPYQVPPLAVIADAGGSGGVISPTLLVNDLKLLSPGAGYDAAPPLTFEPLFSSCCNDSFPNSQKALLINWMTAVFMAALQMPIIAVAPVIT